MQYRKKPVVIKAVKYDGNFRCLDIFAISEVSHFIVSKDEEGKQCIKIPTLEGEMTALIGDYIIRGVKGEYYPCKPDIFEMTYESVDTSTQQERMYSEEEVIEFGEMIAWNMVGKTITESFIRTVSKQLFKQLKKINNG
jgi:hypothetical protein